MTLLASFRGLSRATSVRQTGAASTHAACACPFAGFSMTRFGIMPWCSHSAIARPSAASMSTTSMFTRAAGFVSICSCFSASARLLRRSCA